MALLEKWLNSQIYLSEEELKQENNDGNKSNK